MAHLVLVSNASVYFQILHQGLGYQVAVGVALVVRTNGKMQHRLPQNVSSVQVSPGRKFVPSVSSADDLLVDIRSLARKIERLCRGGRGDGGLSCGGNASGWGWRGATYLLHLVRVTLPVGFDGLELPSHPPAGGSGFHIRHWRGVRVLGQFGLLRE